MPGCVAAVIASQRVRPEVVGPMTSSAKQSSQRFELDCFVAALLAVTLARKFQNMHTLAPAIDQVEPAVIVGSDIV
jgi:hypothetical protein